jgi:hypothetical protein
MVATTARPRRAAIALLGGVLGALLGGVLGALWFSIYGPEGELFGEIAAALAGGVVGGLAGSAWGWSLSPWRAAPVGWRAAAVLGWIACGTLLVVGIVYIGGWTDSDGPNPEAMVGILGIPVSFLGVWLISRSLRRADGARS